MSFSLEGNSNQGAFSVPTFESPPTLAAATAATTSTGNDVLSYLQSVSWVTWIIIILVLAFFGFNIFSYLAIGTQDLTDFLKPLLTKLAGLIALVSGQIVATSAQGGQDVVNGTAYALDKGLGVIEEGANQIKDLGDGSSTSSGQEHQQHQQQQPPPPKPMSSQDAAIAHALAAQGSEPVPFGADESSSKMQQQKKSSSWCYIGEDRGFRSCAEIGPQDVCMSGDIFPSQDICINPSLRA
jgi:hypothetical protein